MDEYFPLVDYSEDTMSKTEIFSTLSILGARAPSVLDEVSSAKVDGTFIPCLVPSQDTDILVKRLASLGSDCPKVVQKLTPKKEGGINE
jgi:hypothetical protein